MFCQAHNSSAINPPKAYAIVQECICARIPPAYPHPNAAIFDSFKESAITQQFSVPDPILYYVISKMNAITLSKIKKSCKTLKGHAQKFRGFALSRLDLQFGYVTFFDVQQMKMTITTDNFNFENIFKGVNLSGEYFTLCSYRSDVLVGAKVLSNVTQCRFRHIDISNQILSWDEMNMLLGPQVISFKTKGIAFKDLELEDGSVEKIVARLPNAEYLSLLNLNFGPFTAQRLAELPQKNNVGCFEISKVPEDFDKNYFGEFVKKNLIPKSQLLVRFDVDVPKKCRDKFRQTLKKVVKSKFEESERPTISVRCAEDFS